MDFYTPLSEATAISFTRLKKEFLLKFSFDVGGIIIFFIIKFTFKLEHIRALL